MTIRTAAAILAVACSATFAAAQPRHPATQACPRIDIKAAWFRSQLEFANDSRRDWSDEELRQRLLVAAGFDASAGFTPETGWRLAGPAAGAPVDSSLGALLRGMAAKRQWPTRSAVGAAGVHAAWRVAQRDEELAEFAMHRMMEAGPGEVSPAEVAVLQDAQRVKAGRGQIFGTQFIRDDKGAVVLARLEDSAHVDMRREAAWLPRLAVSACLARMAAR
jgi:hypothetical protein